MVFRMGTPRETRPAPPRAALPHTDGPPRPPGLPAEPLKCMFCLEVAPWYFHGFCPVRKFAPDCTYFESVEQQAPRRLFLYSYSLLPQTLRLLRGPCFPILLTLVSASAIHLLPSPLCMPSPQYTLTHQKKRKVNKGLSLKQTWKVPPQMIDVSARSNI